MIQEIRTEYYKLLEGLADELDIPPSMYQEAVRCYTAVGKFLEDGEYEDCSSTPAIYPQGSFRIGTVVRPIKEGKESDYDIDLVCELKRKKDSRPDNVKAAIGDRLKEDADYRRMLDDEGKRCWRLNYAEEDGIGFHLDVLPSTPESEEKIDSLIRDNVPPEFAKKAIAITHKDEKGEYSWLSSNPKGYAEWFDLVKMPIHKKIAKKQKEVILAGNLGLYANIDEVPDQLVKTPLQKAIQILKRHRDKRFVSDEWEDDKPISMIITTLSARLYQSEDDVYSTLKNIVEKLDAHAQLLKPGQSLKESLANLRLIEINSDGTWHIPNPVDPDENFADRWHEKDHRKARAFFKWVSWVKNDLVDILNQGDIEKIRELLQEIFGKDIINRAYSRLLRVAPALVISSGKSNKRIVVKNPSKPWGNHG